MSRVRRLGATTIPLLVVQWIIAISAIIGGIYVVSPFMRLSILFNGKSAVIQTVGSEWGIYLFGGMFILSGVLMIAGIILRKVQLRSLGLFINGLCRLYAIIAAILAVGILPLTWLSNFTIMCIVFYIWGRIRRRGIE